MTISFNQIPNNIRTPGVFTEFDASRAVSNLGLQRQLLVFGNKLAAGTQPAEQIFEVQSLDQAREAAGVGSHFADMIEVLLRNNANIRVRGILLDDDAGGVAAEQTITVSGPATGAGTLFVYVADRVTQVAVASGDTADQIAANIEAALSADVNLLFTASVLSNVVTLECKHAAEFTEKLPVAVNPYPPEANGNQRLPEGVTVAVANSVTGSGNPDVDDALAAMPDEVINYILFPYVDDSNLDKLDTKLAELQGPMVQNEGHGFNAFAGTLSEATTFGSGRNGQHNTTMFAGNGSLSAEHQWAAAYIGQATIRAVINPATPWTGLKLIGVEGRSIDGAPVANRLTRSERETLLNNGVATHLVDQNTGEVSIERGITNYQTNSLSIPDTSFLDSMTSLTLSDLRQTFLQRMTARYFSQGFKLVKDGGNIPGGAKTVSPSIIRGEIISLAQDWIDLELVEPGSLAQFKADLIVEIDGTDPNRVNVQSSPDLVNQLRVIAHKILFIL